MFVADPEAFIASRKVLWIVVIDETPFWVKLRGEEKVLLSTAETHA